LYSDFKLLFAVAVILILGTTYFALKSREEFPFLLFGMYSLKEQSQDEYIAYSIVVDGKELIYGNMRDAEVELVETSLNNAVSLKSNPLATTAFTNWLKSYTADCKAVEIYKLTCLYVVEGKPLIKKRELIYPHGQF
jgi:hypothetical protein